MKPETIRELEKPLDRAHVAKREKGGQQLSYVEGWHVIAEANRIFGFDGWTRELVDLIENTQPTTNAKGNFIVSFRAKVRISVGGVVREGTGFGSGIARDIHDAYESAVKEAETDAMKRAFMTFGNPFGLALYDKSQANVADAPSHALEALRANIPATTKADAREWWEKQKPALNDLPDSEFAIFKSEFMSRLATLPDEQSVADNAYAKLRMAG